MPSCWYALGTPLYTIENNHGLWVTAHVYFKCVHTIYQPWNVVYVHRVYSHWLLMDCVYIHIYIYMYISGSRGEEGGMKGGRGTVGEGEEGRKRS